MTLSALRTGLALVLAVAGSACVTVNSGESDDEGGGGGGGSGGGGDVARYAGCYWGTYQGNESGGIQVDVSPTGTVSLVAVSPRGAERYTGTIDGDGPVTVNGTIAGNYTVTYTGALPDEVLGREGSGSWKSSSGYTGSWAVAEAPLVGAYQGQAVDSDGDSMPFTASVTCSQSLDVTVAGQVFHGHVDRDGKATASGTISGAGYTVQYAGAFQLVGGARQGNGSWSSSGGIGGTWTATAN
jgi:hypothetical protein